MVADYTRSYYVRALSGEWDTDDPPFERPATLGSQGG
jgi:hypothetical protein